LDFGLNATTCVRRPAFKEVYAIIYGSDKGYRSLGNGLGFLAEQGDDCGFAALTVLRRILFAVIIVILAGLKRTG